MSNYPVLSDIHTHSISSGHGTRDTVTDMARTAAERFLKILGISDHGPKTPGAGDSSYFRNLRLAQRGRFGVSLLYGVELNILNENGDVDLEDSITASLDYAFISMHHPVFRGGDGRCLNVHSGMGSGNRLNAYGDMGSGSADANTGSNAYGSAFRDICTNAYINAMKHPGVRFIGHPDDGRFPADYERLLCACAKYRVYPEINNASLMPDAYRMDGYKNSMKILSLCKKMRLPVLLSSDSHGREHIGDMKYIFPLLKECDFPEELVINGRMEFLLELLGK